MDVAIESNGPSHRKPWNEPYKAMKLAIDEPKEPAIGSNGTSNRKPWN